LRMVATPWLVNVRDIAATIAAASFWGAKVARLAKSGPFNKKRARVNVDAGHSIPRLAMDTPTGASWCWW